MEFTNEQLITPFTQDQDKALLLLQIALGTEPIKGQYLTNKVLSKKLLYVSILSNNFGWVYSLNTGSMMLEKQLSNFTEFLQWYNEETGLLTIGQLDAYTFDLFTLNSILLPR